MADDGRFNNYHLGGFVILLGLVFVGCNGLLHLGRYGVTAEPALVGLAIVALGMWAIVKEYRRRRRDGR